MVDTCHTFRRGALLWVETVFTVLNVDVFLTCLYQLAMSSPDNDQRYTSNPEEIKHTKRMCQKSEQITCFASPSQQNN